ncbi:MAG: shikimate kinase [Muribaculaceae bacterium]|nr:shikimate kinase [Muribaculaceae bacterium]
MKPVFLIGYMGSGKSTMGRSLSAYMNKELIDLDHYIEARYHQSVKDIFSERGEEAFRIIEKNMLHEVGEFENTIIACGGGTPCYFDNMEFMKNKGITVFLNASHEALMRRLSTPKAKSKRPIISNKSNEELAQFITEAIEKRYPYYSQAEIHFDSDWLEDGKQVAASTKALAEKIKSFS